MHLTKDLIGYGKQVVRTTQDKAEFKKLYSEYRKLKSPLKKKDNLGDQVILWNKIASKQKNWKQAFYCEHQTILLRNRENKLPIIKQLNSIRNFCFNAQQRILNIYTGYLYSKR
jgi:hypothetical protein